MDFVVFFAGALVMAIVWVAWTDRQKKRGSGWVSRNAAGAGLGCASWIALTAVALIVGLIEPKHRGEQEAPAAATESGVAVAPSPEPVPKPAAPAPAPPPAPEPKAKGKLDAWVAGKEFARRSLKSPSTADFGSLFGESQSYEESVTVLEENKFRVAGWVDAQNSFGATIRSDFVVLLHYDPSDDSWNLDAPPVVVSR